MGMAVPEGARGDMAAAGEWRVVSKRVVGEVGDDGEFKPLNTGVRKRKLNEEEEEQIAAAEMITKKGWGAAKRSFPGRRTADQDDDIEALFNTDNKPAVKRESLEAETEIKEESEVKGEGELPSLQDIPTAEEATALNIDEAATPDTTVKKEEDVPAPAAPVQVVFKKRKKIAK